MESREIEQKAEKKAPKRVFVAAFVVVFFCAFSVADSLDAVPCYVDGTCTQDSVALSSLPILGITATSSTDVASSGIEPVEIKIPAVGIDLPVQNPATTDVNALDALLNQGPARYAPSADLGDSGNVIIFAHSSHLPIVHNQMFKAFNDIPNLNPGDTITLVGTDGKSYTYAVDSIVKADTNDGTQIPLSPTIGKKLTLVTCDTLTGVSARYILTASFVSAS